MRRAVFLAVLISITLPVIFIILGHALGFQLWPSSWEYRHRPTCTVSLYQTDFLESPRRNLPGALELDHCHEIAISHIPAIA